MPKVRYTREEAYKYLVTKIGFAELAGSVFSDERVFLTKRGCTF